MKAPITYPPMRSVDANKSARDLLVRRGTLHIAFVEIGASPNSSGMTFEIPTPLWRPSTFPAAIRTKPSFSTSFGKGLAIISPGKT